MARGLKNEDNARQELRICHLYPDLMDTYGDRGNIITLIKRCQWRGIKASVTNISVGNTLSAGDFDIFFFGGGQDRQQEIVGRDLPKKAKALKTAIEGGTTLLSICGGYQLLQNYFKTLDGITIEGIGLFDAYTQGSTTRMIGNLLIDINPSLDLSFPPLTSLEVNSRESSSRFRIKSGMTGEDNQLIGFENHSGKTYLEKNLKPLGKVIKGAGNNGEDKTEGAIFKNAFGCYLHGSLLPKNPHFADYLISKALERRYGKIRLKPLDDSIEWQAHESAIKQTRSQT
ncbi:glutamine amidotransferase [Candidatus Curtissbacteria bacterium]|nr:glutamine amidotransferase [Candidatus Curtissbacteria bacterium]